MFFDSNNPFADAVCVFVNFDWFGDCVHGVVWLVISCARGDVRTIAKRFAIATKKCTFLELFSFSYILSGFQRANC